MHSFANFIIRQTGYIRSILLISVILFISGCSVNEPGSSKSGGLSIQIEGVSSTEAWIRIKAEAIGPNDIISLQRDGQAVLLFSLHGKDTLICQDSLTPGRSYTYRALRNTSVLSFPSENVSIRTMDTTSHDFHFRTFWVCNRSSYLSDVAIINENDIWAVGDMLTNLPEGKEDYEPVGAVHWDGKEWKQVKLPAVASPTYNTFLTPMDILAFSPTDIWFANGGVIHFDGKKVTKCYWICDFPGNTDNPIMGDGKGITRIWGTSSSNIYAAGYKGAIAHFDGKTWKKIESGTDMDIQAVWGNTDPTTGEEVVICVASNLYSGDLPKVLQIKNDKVTELPIEGLRYSLRSVWFSGINKILLGGDGIYTLTQGLNTSKWDDKYDEVTNNFTYSIAGNGSSDFAVAGGYGDICHFNGKTWKSYLGNEVEAFYGNLYGMDMKGNTICAVGGMSRASVIMLGQR